MILVFINLYSNHAFHPTPPLKPHLGMCLKRRSALRLYALLLLLCFLSACGGDSKSDPGIPDTPTNTNQAPQINLIGEANLTLTVGGTFSDPGANATDNEDGDLSSSIIESSSVDLSQTGVFTITYSITDSGGLIDTVTRTITVVDADGNSNSEPTISLIGASTIAIEAGGIFIDPGATASDPEDGDLTALINVTSNIDTGTPGIYTVQYDVVDSQGASPSREARRNVIISSASSDGGTVTAALDVLTRVNGVSPETVYFSAQNSVDPACEDWSGGNDQEACRTGQFLGFHFNFDDPNSEAETFATTGFSKNQQVSGAPRAIHTFVCDGESNTRWNPLNERCEYNVGVRVQNPSGGFDDAFIQVNIVPQHIAYSGNDTYCISSDINFADCPANVPTLNRLDDIPDTEVFNFSNKRILIERGSSGAYSPICIAYEENSVRVDTYGNGSDPIIEFVQIGVHTGCGDKIPNNVDALNYPVLEKNASGYITQGWAYDIGVTNLRIGYIDNGMAATLVTMHNLDLDWSETGQFASGISIMSSGQNCDENNNLDCDLVPYPYGIFVSEVRSLSHVDNRAGLNFDCLANCGMVNSGIIGSEGKTAFEHNLRVMGAWGLIVSNSWFRGGHYLDPAINRGRPSGPKSKITLRQISSDEVGETGGQGTLSSQFVNPEDFDMGNHDGDGPGWMRETLDTRHFTPHYNFVIDNLIHDPVQTNSIETAMVQLQSGHRYSGVFGTEFLTYVNGDTNNVQIQIGGNNVVAVGTTYNGYNEMCRVARGPRHENQSDTYWLDPNTIFSEATSGPCSGELRSLPVFPSAPESIVTPGADGLALLACDDEILLGQLFNLNNPPGGGSGATGNNGEGYDPDSFLEDESAFCGSITVENESWYFILDLPIDYDSDRSQPYTLAFGWHGCGQGSSGRMRSTVRLTERNNVVATYPRSNDSGGCWYEPSFSAGELVFDALRSAIVNRYNVTEQAVLAGFSAGAFMSNYLSCTRANDLRGVVSVAGGADMNDFPACGSPVPIYIGYNEDDLTAPFDPWYGRVLDFYTNLNQCNGNEQSVTPSFLGPGDTRTCHQQSCSASTTYCTNANGGHNAGTWLDIFGYGVQQFSQ